MPAVPDGASCYFCLDDGPDEEGKPLVRDCSCRGDAAGFAHLSCIIKYAEQKSKLVADDDFSTAFAEPWHTCPNCKQPYQRQLILDLSSAFVTSAEATYGHLENSKWDKIRVMQSLQLKIITLHLSHNDIMADNSPHTCQDVAVTTLEREMLIKKLLSMIEKMKKDEKMDGWLHMPRTSFEYVFCGIIGYFEAGAHERWGWLKTLDKTEESYKIALKHLEKARIIYNLFGFNKAKNLENNIAAVRALSARSNKDEANVCATVFLENARINYARKHEMLGLTSVETIQSGLHYAEILLRANCGIEAERLLMKLAPDSRLVHGPEHDCTTRAEKLLELCKKRYANVLPDGKPFQVLRYENDGEICVLTGPITEPREIDDESMFHIASDLVQPIFGCPVVCHGLVSASHLNGKVGDVRAWHKNGKVEIHFEDKSQKPAVMKPENLRIAFELPTEG